EGDGQISSRRRRGRAHSSNPSRRQGQHASGHARPRRRRQSGDGRVSTVISKTTPPEDCWALWIRQRRQGGPDLSPDLVKDLQRRRDSVLDRAALQPGDSVLDVGCGDGLIGFGALDRVGPEGHVIFSDVSASLVQRCRAIAENPNLPSPSGGGQGGGSLLDRCRFVVNSADHLHDIEDASVDVVTTRSVLIYVDRKDRAFAEFFRVDRK